MLRNTLISSAFATRRHDGIGLLRQLSQMLTLRFGPGRLDPWEYYFFEVFRKQFTPEQKRRFVGWRGEIRLDRAANARSGRRLANDKLAFHERLARDGFPLPDLIAVYGCPDRRIAGTVSLTEPDQATAFLRETDRLPLFAKPVRGAHGHDAFLIRAYADGDLILAPDERIRASDFIAGLEPLRKRGVLFQECLRTAGEIEAVCGNRLTTMRIIVVVTDDGPQVIGAVWRVPTGANVIDNFSCGKTGNVIADVDLGSGRIGRTVQGVGWDNRPLDRHPDTGVAFGEFELPGWRQTRELVLEAAGILPGLRLQHWDVAITDRGPVILEVNVEGGMRTHQIVRQCGLLDERLSRLSSAP